jgi:hypothetical protein
MDKPSHQQHPHFPLSFSFCFPCLSYFSFSLSLFFLFFLCDVIKGKETSTIRATHVGDTLSLHVVNIINIMGLHDKKKSCNNMNVATTIAT